ncbi:hypothetical protein J3L16_03685 [Alteromonas sp. 5E99-2]|uniref:hypothetical protein n=1 Tax=Alteromonas sp. 5E99-2 TaxID=2817683 RepID=UPI001A98372D|nr:hypothetical protein [Alteromonas sp. 5E99-2]MBO1254788.1 hypothetical protein [Alteromonas sp. 5E99-2]
MSILTTDPQTGWKRFTKGLAVFFVGLLLILLMPNEQKELLYFSIAILGCGFAYAMTGYIPMLFHRLTSAKRASKHIKFHDDE